MARLDIEIGGSDKGGNASLKETVGLLEKLISLKNGLSIDLFKAETTDEIRSVGEKLTGVNLQIGQYLTLASKATQAWQDNKTSAILDNLATKVAIARTNAQAFGESIRTQTTELRAYQSAFDQLIENGLDRTSTEIMSLETHISRLTTSISAQKQSIGEQKAYDSLANKLKAIESNMGATATASQKGSATVRAYQSAITELVRSGIDPADNKIKSLQEAIRSVNVEMSKDSAREMSNSFRKTGVILEDARNKVRQLQHYLNFATSERSIATLNKKLVDAQKELTRLNQVGLSSADVMHKFGAQSSSAGVEFARIIQDAPYAANNLGSIGNNVTRLTEIWPQYTSRIKEAIEAQGKVATSGAVLREGLKGMVSGANGWILAISAVVTGLTIWQQVSQSNRRALEAEQKALKDYSTRLDEHVGRLDAVTQANIKGLEQGSKDIAQLKALRAAVEDETVARTVRERAVKSLQKLYPDYFGNLSKEQILAGNVAGAYDNLTRSILRSARAKAAMDMIAENESTSLKIDMARIDRQKQLTKEQQNQLGIVKEIEAITGKKFVAPTDDQMNLSSKVVDYLPTWGDKVNELSKAYIESRAAESKLEGERREAFLAQQKAMKDNMYLQNLVNEDVKNGAKIVEDSVLKDKKARTKQVRAIKEVRDAISSIYNPEVDSGNLVGLEGLDKSNKATMNKYMKLLGEVSDKEADWARKYKAQVKSKVLSAEQANAKIVQLEKEAAAERAQINAGMEAEIKANTAKFALEKAQALSEAEDRAGRTRISSRERDIQAEQAYWKTKEVELKKFGITSKQIEEMRKSAEAQINMKWDQKMIEDSFIYKRRGGESLTQLLIRRLNKETELELKNAKGNAEEKLRIQKKYFEQMRAIESRREEVDFMSNFDGSLFTTQINAVKAQMENLKLAADGNTGSLKAYGDELVALQTKMQFLEVMKAQFQSLGDTIGSSLIDNLFEGKSLMEGLEEGMKNMAKTILKELIKIGARYLINQAIGTSSMAATTATSVVAAKTTAAAWSTAAAMVAAATFGASAAAGGAAIAGLIASTKALSLAGFSSGGYTGSKGRNEIAGFVHGQEFVVRASAVSPETMPMLKALNAGQDYSKFVPKTSTARNFGSVSERVVSTQQIVVSGDIRNDTIHVSNRRAERFNTKFGRG